MGETHYTRWPLEHGSSHLGVCGGSLNTLLRLKHWILELRKKLLDLHWPAEETSANGVSSVLPYFRAFSL